MIDAPSMRYLPLCVAVLALCAPGPAAAGTVVSTFYYPWFGTTTHDGEFAHWEFDGTWTGWYEDGSKPKVAVYDRGIKKEEKLYPRPGE